MLLIADIPGMSRELYRQAITQVRDQLRTAPGFVAHAGTPTAEGFRVTEIWESRDTLTRFLEETIMPMAQQLGIPPFQPQILEADEAFTR